MGARPDAWTRECDEALCVELGREFARRMVSDTSELGTVSRYGKAGRGERGDRSWQKVGAAIGRSAWSACLRWMWLVRSERGAECLALAEEARCEARMSARAAGGEV